MVFPRARLVVAALLFLAWLGYLAYLAAVSRNLVVVSRPQILVADVLVVARIEESPDGKMRAAKVREVLWPAAEGMALVDAVLDLDGLAELDERQGWTGSDDYILALSRRREEKVTRYTLTQLPPMPGFQPSLRVDLWATGKDGERVARHLQETLGLPAAQAQALIQAPATLRRFMRRATAFKLQQELEDLGAEVHLAPDDTRIYPYSEDVVRQVRELRLDAN